jgi:hypothetical protein
MTTLRYSLWDEPADGWHATVHEPMLVDDKVAGDLVDAVGGGGVRVEEPLLRGKGWAALYVEDVALGVAATVAGAYLALSRIVARTGTYATLPPVWSAACDGDLTGEQWEGVVAELA